MAINVPAGGTRIHWHEGERRILAKVTTNALISQGVDVEGEEDGYVMMLAMQPLQQAIQTRLEPHRRRVITGPHQVSDWLLPEMREMVRAKRGESNKYRKDVLEPYAAREPDPVTPREGDGEWEWGVVDNLDVEPGYGLVSMQEFRDLTRSVRRNTRRLRSVEAKLDTLRETLEAVADLIAGPRPAPGRLPLVVVAGLPDRDHARVTDSCGDRAEVVFVDPRRSGPNEVGDCDWLVLADECGENWAKKARRSYDGKCSAARGADAVAREVGKVVAR